MTVGRFLTPIPEEFLKTPATAEWARQVTLYLDDLSRPEGVLDTSETTAVTTATQATTLVTLQAALDVVDAQLAALQNSLPAYTITNDSTLRTYNANSAVGGTGIDVAAAGPANVALLSDHDALVAVVLSLSDLVATMQDDLANKQLLGT